MRRSQENQLKATLREITKLRNKIYKELERQQTIQNDDFEKDSDIRIAGLLIKIKYEADTMTWKI